MKWKSHARSVARQRKSPAAGIAISRFSPRFGVAQCEVDGFLRVEQEFFLGLAKAGVGRVGALDHLAQCIAHGGQVGLELLDGGAKAGYLWPLEAEEQLEQLAQRLVVGPVFRNFAAQHFLPVLPQHGKGVVAEDDVVLRIAFAEFFRDFGVQRPNQENFD